MVSTTAVDLRSLASSTGMNCPVLASRPILHVAIGGHLLSRAVARAVTGRAVRDAGVIRSRATTISIQPPRVFSAEQHSSVVHGADMAVDAPQGAPNQHKMKWVGRFAHPNQ